MSGVAADRLTQLLSRMDARDDKGATLAMREAAQLLQVHGLSFQKLVEQIEARCLLLPSRIGTAIKMMDSTTASESEVAFGAVRKLMHGCGLTFARLTEALEHQPVDVAELEKLRAELEFQKDNARHLQRQVVVLRTASGISQGGSSMSWFSRSGSAVLVNVLVAVVAVFALTWLVLWFKTEGPSAVVQAAVAQPIQPPSVRQAPSAPLGPPVYGGPCYWLRRSFWDGYGWRVRNVRICG
jgi:hypothetical protein